MEVVGWRASRCRVPGAGCRNVTLQAAGGLAPASRRCRCDSRSIRGACQFTI